MLYDDTMNIFITTAIIVRIRVALDFPDGGLSLFIVIGRARGCKVGVGVGSFEAMGAIIQDV